MDGFLGYIVRREAQRIMTAERMSECAFDDAHHNYRDNNAKRESIVRFASEVVGKAWFALNQDTQAMWERGTISAHELGIALIAIKNLHRDLSRSGNYDHRKFNLFDREVVDAITDDPGLARRRFDIAVKSGAITSRERTSARRAVDKSLGLDVESGRIDADRKTEVMKALGGRSLRHGQTRRPQKARGSSKTSGAGVAA